MPIPIIKFILFKWCIPMSTIGKYLRRYIIRILPPRSDDGRVLKCLVELFGRIIVGTYACSSKAVLHQNRILHISLSNIREPKPYLTYLCAISSERNPKFSFRVKFKNNM